ncbi:EpsG family protein [Enterobacteriaceae bacterium H4N4]|uniref:EpsG family protein n=1 Tax=Silvania confinis TaxID=2926470 RepID=A0A9J6QGY7_9ENTR|nr:EpsG family protein [Silvania confinis]MCU6670153.1 EpsG family protein [Silvania confinis]
MKENKENIVNLVFFAVLGTLVLSFFMSNTQFFGLSRDYENYKAIFSGSAADEVQLELFYRILLALTNSYQLIIFTVLLISLVIKTSFFVKNTKSKQGLIIFLLYYAFVSCWILDYTQIRNGLCISILMFSIYYLFNKRLTPFYISVFIAITAHWSALPFLLLYPYVHWRKARIIGNAIAGVFVLIYLSGNADTLISIIRNYGIGQKIGNDGDVNLLNSLSLTFITWFLISIPEFKVPTRKYFINFFAFAFLQYMIFVMYSLPVTAFRVLEAYFFLMVTASVISAREKRTILIFLMKIVIISYMAFYYHVMFGVLNE